jgi:hypothetical protein
MPFTPRRVVDRERLVIGHADERRLRVVRTGSERVREVEDVLVEERHLTRGIGVVEVDDRPECPARHRHPDAVAQYWFRSFLKSKRRTSSSPSAEGNVNPAASGSITVAPAVVSAWTAASNESSTAGGVGTFGSKPFRPARVGPSRAPLRPFGSANFV